MSSEALATFRNALAGAASLVAKLDSEILAGGETETVLDRATEPSSFQEAIREPRGEAKLFARLMRLVRRHIGHEYFILQAFRGL